MIEFYKYVAAGNDFIVFDGWETALDLTSENIIALCDRRFGIGADGILILSEHDSSDFQMHYYNSDGSRGEMCGNGARSLVRFADLMGKARPEGSFYADDGFHQYQVGKHLIDVEIIVNNALQAWEIPNSGCGFIDTGVPHLVIPVEEVSQLELDPLGVRMNKHAAHPHGINTNIVENSEGALKVRTWERGVNKETLACGTGAAATAIYAHEHWRLSWPISLSFKGGSLEVDHRGNQYWLKGPAELVFKGRVSLSSLYTK